LTQDFQGSVRIDFALNTLIFVTCGIDQRRWSVVITIFTPLDFPVGVVKVFTSSLSITVSKSPRARSTGVLLTSGFRRFHCHNSNRHVAEWVSTYHTIPKIKASEASNLFGVSASGMQPALLYIRDIADNVKRNKT
jgi:hypothetical protein